MTLSHSSSLFPQLLLCLMNIIHSRQATSNPKKTGWFICVLWLLHQSEWCSTDTRLAEVALSWPCSYGLILKLVWLQDNLLVVCSHCPDLASTLFGFYVKAERLRSLKHIHFSNICWCHHDICYCHFREIFKKKRQPMDQICLHWRSSNNFIRMFIPAFFIIDTILLLPTSKQPKMVSFGFYCCSRMVLSWLYIQYPYCRSSWQYSEPWNLQSKIWMLYSDKMTNSPQISYSNQSQAINRGAILQVFISFGHDQSIFSYRPVFNFIQSPLSLLFEYKYHQRWRLASKIMADLTFYHPSVLITNVVAKDQVSRYQSRNLKLLFHPISFWPGQQGIINSQPPEHTPSSNATNSSRRNVDRSSKTFLWQCLQLWIPKPSL